MTAPIEQGLSNRIPEIEDPQLKAWIEREVIPVLSKAREIINESTWHYVSNTDNYAWGMDIHGNLFINQTSGTPTFSIASDVVLKDLRPGRTYTLVLQNATGAAIAPVFSSDFNTTSGTIPNGSRASWRFQVKHPDLTTPTATILEV